MATSILLASSAHEGGAAPFMPYSNPHHAAAFDPKVRPSGLGRGSRSRISTAMTSPGSASSTKMGPVRMWTPSFMLVAPRFFISPGLH